MSTIRTELWELKITREVIDITPTNEPDPAWRYTDPAGHEHRYETGVELVNTADLHVATVESVSLGTYWCEGCCDEHEDFEICCKQCSAVVTPGTRAVTDRRFMPGLTEVNGILRQGAPKFDDLLRAFNSDRLEPMHLDLGKYLVSGVVATSYSDNLGSVLPMPPEIGFRATRVRYEQSD